MAKIAIDGPAGAGKSSIAKTVAKLLGCIYIDTGAMYRAAGLYALKQGISIKEEPDRASDAVSAIDIRLEFAGGEQKIFLYGEDVSSAIRTPEVSAAASDISAIPEVRTQLVSLQRKLAQDKDVIMDGRDIGTHVFPDAEVKIYLTASSEVRAERRFRELCEKGTKTTFEEVLESVSQRDKNDMTRAASPLRPADDAVILDTSELDFNESVEAVLEIIKTRSSIS